MVPASSVEILERRSPAHRKATEQLGELGVKVDPAALGPYLIVIGPQDCGGSGNEGAENKPDVFLCSAVNAFQVPPLLGQEMIEHDYLVFRVLGRPGTYLLAGNGESVFKRRGRTRIGLVETNSPEAGAATLLPENRPHLLLNFGAYSTTAAGEAVRRRTHVVLDTIGGQVKVEFWEFRSIEGMMDRLCAVVGNGQYNFRSTG